MNCGGAQLLYVSFNQDLGCFACGLSDGFRIFNTYPVRESFRRVLGAGIGIVEMLFRCNLLALVGGGPNPRFAPNKVMIWDDHQNKCIGELVFKSDVRSVKLRRDRIAVSLQTKTYVYRFSDLKLLDQTVTCDNPKGILAICYSISAFTVVTLGTKTGEILVKMYDAAQEKLISAHSSAIACVAVNQDSSLVASASEKGTLVRIWDPVTGDKLAELRRGCDVAVILSIAFSPASEYLMCSSDKGTIHVFRLSCQKQPSDPTDEKGPAQPGNKHAYIKSILPNFLVPNIQYLESEWSFLQIRGLGKCISGFSGDGTKIMVLTANGTAYTYSFHSDGKTFRENSTKYINSDMILTTPVRAKEADMTTSTTTSAATPAISTISPAQNTAAGVSEEVAEPVRDDSDRGGMEWFNAKSEHTDEKSMV